jgi:hypothetical protein
MFMNGTENGCGVYSAMLSSSVSQYKHGSFPRDFRVTEVRFVFFFACNTFIFNFRMTFDTDHIISHGWCVFEEFNSEVAHKDLFINS